MNTKASTGGFTLLEMVVVLAILAVVTALATREIGYVQDQQRFETSQRSLEAIRGAILGSPDDRAPDGTRTVSGFVADMGRLPLSLPELWVNPAPSFGAFDLRPATAANMAPGQTAEADAEVFVPGGWRGPYVRLSMGATNFMDGWGNVVVFQTAASDPVLVVGHLGADSRTGGVGYDRDDTNSVVVSTPHYTSTAAGYLTLRPSGTGTVSGAVTVRLFGPYSNDASRIAALSSAPTNVVLGTNTVQVPWVITGATMGPRVARVNFAGTPVGRAVPVLLRNGANVVNLDVDL
jgi:prepilin-type N-terminal cleavage/methylation domain-containing protein